jgi:DNA-binding IclR family transcriptional regulator
VQLTRAEHAQHSYLARVDVVLGAFDAEHSALSLGGIMARARLPKTTVFRMVSQLLDLGWMERDGDRYVVGKRLFELASLARVRTRLRELVLPFMQDLYEATHETVHLAVLDDTDVLYIEKIAGHRRAQCPSRVGGRMPAHCTALGKVLLGHAPAALEQVVAAKLRSRTPATIVSANRLRQEVAQVRRDGAGYDREECVPGLGCVAAPLMQFDGRCVAAISIAAPIRRQQFAKLGPVVQAAAMGASQALRVSAA